MKESDGFISLMDFGMGFVFLCLVICQSGGNCDL